MKNQSLTTSIVWMLSIFAISLYLMINVLQQQNTLLTISALVLCVWNAIIVVYLLSQRGK
jgi:hypothetical protein